MRIAINAIMPFNGYSGGRYCAYLMAECLVSKKDDVFFICDTIPGFRKDFTDYPGHNRIKFIVTNNFDVSDKVSGTLDYVIVFPGINLPPVFYQECRNFVLKKKAKLVVFNFETPNWFNKYSKSKRDVNSWHGIREYLCSCGCLILSSAKESVLYAREFYNRNDPYLRFDYWYNAINSISADSVSVKKEKAIVAMVSLSQKHKKSEDLLRVLDQDLSGYRVVLISGSGKIDKAYLNKLDSLSKRNNFQYEIKVKLNDHEKFKEMKRAMYLLHLSVFEGYGLPPVEARYCNTLPLVYDLPIFREIHGNEGIVYCEHDQPDDMREKLRALIGSNYFPQNLKTNVMEKGSFAIRAEAVHNIFQSFIDDDFHNPQAEIIAKLSNTTADKKHKLKCFAKNIVCRLARR